jgi:uncharacterized protein with HEPN domain
MLTYCCEFEMDGHRYVQNIEAESFEDAEKRIEAIKQSMVLLGEFGGSVPATPEQAFAAVAGQQSKRKERPNLKVVSAI